MLRDQYLKSINKLRKQIAEGSANNNNQGKCPQGQNVYKLSWDQCKLDVAPPAGNSQLIKRVESTCNPTKILKTSIPDWWNKDVQNVGVDNPPLNKQGLEEFAKLANGRAAKIGCAQRNCNEQLFVACVINEPAPAANMAIYEVGKGCNCTTYLDSKCSNNLCIAGHPGDNTICPENQIISDTIRRKFMNDHNQRRSLLATGAVSMASGPARRASKMRRLGYDCAAERSAYEAAKKCLNTPSSPANYDENMRHTNINIDQITAAGRGSNGWWNEVYNLRMNQDATLNRYYSNLGIPNFANMAWDSHAKLGCAVVNCRTFWNVICHYTPKTRSDGGQMYKMGPQCRRCRDYGNPSCNNSDGLCNAT
ncbi:SCP-like protein [Ancylostoma caninum]|uniref:SCP-like protein n=1 Tax=Ancylostoma caninum TaxID=29170 RepID=A0A368H216_ANCCA|nr:SCP-like protein [Ancylostoma caninum]